MTKTLGLTSIVLGSLILSGCGGGGSNVQTLSATETAQNKLLGDWELIEDSTTGCRNDTTDGTSEKVVFTFTKNNVLSDDKVYSELNCQESDLDYYATGIYDYTIGQQTKGSHNEVSYEMDITQTGFTLHSGQSNGSELEDIGIPFYTMVTFDGEKLKFANDNQKMDGSTKEKRANTFDSNAYWTKI